MSRHEIRAKVLPDGLPMTVIGRDAWALERLIDAGERGCTPINQPAPRWAHYVWKLRTKHGLVVETIDEPHGGTFSGYHARYVLRSNVKILRGEDRREAASASAPLLGSAAAPDHGGRC